MTTSNNSTTSDPYQLPEGGRAAPKRLFRSHRDKILAGVAGGMAEYLDMDPTVVRLLWVLAAFFTGGAVFWLYLALWLFLPIGDNTQGQIADPAIKLSEKSLGIVAWGLIALGMLWLLSNFGILPTIWRSFHGIFHLIGLVFWPLVLLAMGWLILSRLGHTDAITQKMKGSVPEADAVRERVRSGYHTVRERTPLKRSKTDRMLLGVCAGIAHWLNLDPLVVRILWALFSIASLGTGVALYIIMAIIMPEDDSDGAIETVEGEVIDPVIVPNDAAQ